MDELVKEAIGATDEIDHENQFLAYSVPGDSKPGRPAGKAFQKMTGRGDSIQALRRSKVLVMHSDPVLALGLSTMLSGHSDIEVQHCDVQRQCPMELTTRIHAADVIVSDYETGLVVLRAPRHVPSVISAPRVMVITSRSRECEIRSAMSAGASGYVLQSCSLGEILDGVRVIDQGARYLCNAVAHSIADSLAQVALTTRENEVLELLAAGACNKTIARELDIAVGTVKAHVKSILAKLGASTRTHAVALATGRGLVSEISHRQKASTVVALRARPVTRDLEVPQRMSRYA